MIATIDAKRYPHVARLGDQLLSGNGPDRFEWSIDVFLVGALRAPRTPAEAEQS